MESTTMSENFMRHYGKLRGEEVVILGYNAGTNQLMICRVGGLPSDDQVTLRRIASSPVAQKSDYLIPILSHEQHKSGRDWFNFLAGQLKANRGVVLTIPLKEVTEMNQSQRAFFKGYGKSAEDAVVAEDNVPVVDVDVDYDEVPAPRSAQSNDVQLAMLKALQDISANLNSFGERLEKLETKVKTPKKPGRKPRAKKAAGDNQFTSSDAA